MCIPNISGRIKNSVITWIFLAIFFFILKSPNQIYQKKTALLYDTQ